MSEHRIRFPQFPSMGCIEFTVSELRREIFARISCCRDARLKLGYARTYIEYLEATGKNHPWCGADDCLICMGP